MAHSRHGPAKRPRRSADTHRTSLDDRQKPKHVHFGAVVEYPITPEPPQHSGERTRRIPRRDPSPPPPVRPPPASRQPSKPSSHHRQASSQTNTFPADDYCRRMRSQHDDYTSRRHNSHHSSNTQHLSRSASDRKSGATTSRSSRPRSGDYSGSSLRRPSVVSPRYSYPPVSSSRGPHGGTPRHLDEARYGPRTVSAR